MKLKNFLSTLSKNKLVEAGVHLSKNPVINADELTAKEKCQIANAGKCGECGDDGSFTPCGR